VRKRKRYRSDITRAGAYPAMPVLSTGDHGVET
jgi:hypothetical protein